MTDLRAIQTHTDAGNIVQTSPEDWERARAFVDGPLTERTSPEWVARHRADLVRQSAVFAMMERQHREHRDRIAINRSEAA